MNVDPGAKVPPENEVDINCSPSHGEGAVFDDVMALPDYETAMAIDDQGELDPYLSVLLQEEDHSLTSPNQAPQFTVRSNRADSQDIHKAESTLPEGRDNNKRLRCGTPAPGQAEVLPPSLPVLPPPKPILPNPPPEFAELKETDVLLSAHHAYTEAHKVYKAEVSNNRKAMSAEQLKTKLHKELKKKNPDSPPPTFWIEYSKAKKKLGVKNAPPNHFDGKLGTGKWFLVGTTKKQLFLYEATDPRIKADHKQNNSGQRQGGNKSESTEDVAGSTIRGPEIPFDQLFVPGTEVGFLEYLKPRHSAIRSAIDALNTPSEFFSFSKNDDFKKCIRAIRDAQGSFADHYQGEGTPMDIRAEWCKLWAIALSKHIERAVELNECRKTALHLVYKACDFCTGGNWDLEASQIQDDLINRVLPLRHVSPILVRCVPMDRASCLYNMRNEKSDKIGLGWYSKWDKEAYKALSNPPLPLNDKCPSINKRLRWLQKNFFKEDDMIQYFLEVQAPEHLLN